MPVAILLLLILGPGDAFAAEVDAVLLERAEQLLAEGKPSDVVALLEPRAAEFAGQPRFDYLLGIAALDANQPELAVTALMRVVQNEPRFAGARLELARAYIAAGQLAAARTLLDQLLAEGPGPGTRAVIERYLAQIEQRAPRDASALQWFRFIDVGAGYDSNVNVSPSDSQFQGFVLNPQEVAAHSPFGELGGGVAWQSDMRRDRAHTGYVRATHRAHPDAQSLDHTVGQAGATYYQKVGRAVLSASVNAFNVWLDGAQHQNVVNLDLGLTRRFQGPTEVSALARVGRMSFARQELRALDVDRLFAAVSVTRHGLRGGRGRVGTVLLGGRDETRRAGSVFSNDKLGARLFGVFGLGARTTIYGEASLLRSYYDGQVFFGRRRVDEQFVAFFGADFVKMGDGPWTVSPQLRWTDTRSSVGLYAYRRWEAMVFVRRAFGSR